MERNSLSRYARLSILAAILTIALKTAAYFYTHSVGLLSDAMESLINLAAAALALWMIKIAAQPPDDDHEFGHDKAEYFSSGIEGALIFIAALSIAYAAVSRFFAPQPIENLGIGLVISLIAALINLFVGLMLVKAGKKHHSIILEADGRHLLTDVWTSAGVVAAIILISLTGWLMIDPLIALIVAANITWTGYQLIRRSALGLMDTVVSEEDLGKTVEILDEFVKNEGIDYHALRSRQAGAKKFISVHILVPDEWTVQRGHDLTERVEQEICRNLGDCAVFTHLEPIADPLSFEDLELFRNK